MTVRWLYDNVTIETHRAGNVYVKATLVAAYPEMPPYERIVLDVTAQMRDTETMETAREKMDAKIEACVGVRPEFVRDVRVEETKTRREKVTP